MTLFNITVLIVFTIINIPLFIYIYYRFFPKLYKSKRLLRIAEISRNISMVSYGVFIYINWQNSIELINKNPPFAPNNIKYICDYLLLFLIINISTLRDLIDLDGY